jgi:haloacetate dehalogenase
MGQEAYEDFRSAIHDPATVHAMMEDYRAGLGIDRALDDADKAAARRITCPVLVLWASKDDMVDLYGDPVAIWREWATDVRGTGIESGHHIAEEAPEALMTELAAFLPRD